MELLAAIAMAVIGALVLCFGGAVLIVAIVQMFVVAVYEAAEGLYSDTPLYKK